MDRPEELASQVGEVGGRAVPGANPERVRVTYDVDESLSRQLRREAANQGCPMSDVARQALIDYLQAIKRAAEEEQFKKTGRDTDAKKRKRFLEAVELKFGVMAACKTANVSRDDVKKWMAEEGFDDLVSDAQEAYIEGVEAELLEVGSGTKKGQPLALMTFLNAHHPSYGRVKAENLSRIIGPIIDKFFTIIRAEVGEGTAESVIEKCRKVAEKRLSDFTD